MKILKTLLLLALLAVVCAGLNGCAFRRVMRYADAEKYTVGDAVLTGPVENVEIDWLSGSVRIGTHAEDTVLVTEENDRELPDDLRVHWWLDGVTLHIKFSASQARSRIDLGRKELTVTLPERAVLNSLAVNTASAKVSADILRAEDVSINTASGAVDAAAEAAYIRLDSTSGGISLRQSGDTEKLVIRTTSGAVDAQAERVERAELDSTSGGIRVSAGRVDDLSARTTSGAVDIRAAEAPRVGCAVNSTSGSVSLTLPENAGFAARVHTTSGSFHCDFPVRKDGGSYICGSGRCVLDLSTTSGGIRLYEYR